MGAGDHNFAGGWDRTASRALNTNYTNGVYRRWVFVSLVCTGTATGQAFAGCVSVAGGWSWSSPGAVGMPSGIAGTGRFQLVFCVDPGQQYQVTSSITGTGTVTIQQWIEVDE